ncbi:MAG: HNH endonuclease [Nitrospira sp.]|nr:MAG: HNH endonuclease [Nitrospira sp.]
MRRYLSGPIPESALSHIDLVAHHSSLRIAHSARVTADTVRVCKYKRKQRTVTSNHLTAAQLAVLRMRQGGRCYWCCCELVECRTHLDHVLPLSRGGAHSLENVRFSCQSCNIAKGARHPLSFVLSLLGA